MPFLLTHSYKNIVPWSHSQARVSCAAIYRLKVGARFIAPVVQFLHLLYRRQKPDYFVKGHTCTSNKLPHSFRVVPFFLLACICLISILLSGCDTGSTTPTVGQQKQTFSSTSQQQITYSTDPQKVLIRTFYGGGLYGSFELAPQISIYGDGTYILGLDQQGQLKTDQLQSLLNTLIDTNDLLDLKRQQFSDIPDQNATYLDLSLNGKSTELVYGSFGNRPESTPDMDEYQRLANGLTAITEALTGPTHTYSNSNQALLVRRTFSTDGKVPLYWPLTSFTLLQASVYECGVLPSDTDPNAEVDPNKELGCLKYTVPDHAFLPDNNQLQLIKDRLNGAQNGIFVEGASYYAITLRPLLPDELPQKSLAMFGSAQYAYKPVPLQEGSIPSA